MTVERIKSWLVVAEKKMVTLSIIAPIFAVIIILLMRPTIQVFGGYLIGIIAGIPSGYRALAKQLRKDIDRLEKLEVKEDAKS